MRTTFRINDQLLVEAKKLAVDTNRTLTELVEDGLREVLGRMAHKEKRRQIVLPVSGGTGLQPGVDISSNTAMLDALE